MIALAEEMANLIIAESQVSALASGLGLRAYAKQA